MAGLLVACTIAAYGNSLGGAFVYDDHGSILENQHIRQLWPLTRALTANRETPVAGRPVVGLSLAINYAIGGISPWGYHAWNLGVHLLCGLLLFGVLRRTFALPSVPAWLRDSADWLAFAAALIWLVHPLQTEAVDYVTQRTESMMGLFYLLTLYGALRSMTGPPSTAARWTLVAIVACALGMATKEPMATAPVVIWLYDAIFVAGSVGRALRERRWLYAGLAATWAIVVALNVRGPRSNSTGFATGVTPWMYLLNQTQMLATYLKLAVWPSPLVFDYGRPQTVSLMDVWPYGLLIVALLVATAVAWWRRPQLAFAGIWFFAILAPSSSFVPIATEVGAERRMYLPLAAVVVLAVVAACFVWVRTRSTFGDGKGLVAFASRPAAVVAALTILTAALMGLTFRCNAEYRTERSIWQTVLDRRPQGRAHYSVAMALKNDGRRDEALEHLRQALADEPEADYAIGFELDSEKRYEEAIGHYREFIKRKPMDISVPRAYHQIGRASIALGKPDQAVAAFREMLRMWPWEADAHGGLADALLQQEKYDEAIAEYREYVRLAPNDASGHFNLGLALVSADRETEAIDAFKRAVALRPGDAVMRETLALALVATRKLDEAVEQYRAALSIEPARVSSHNGLANVLAEQGKIAEAAAEFQKTLAIEPGNAEARSRLAVISR